MIFTPSGPTAPNRVKIRDDAGSRVELVEKSAAPKRSNVLVRKITQRRLKEQVGRERTRVESVPCGGGFC